MLKQAKAGKIVSEDDIPPPVAVSVSAASDQPFAARADVVPRQTPSQPPTVPSVGDTAMQRQAPAPVSIEIPRPTVISGGGQAAAVAPVPKPRTSVQSAMEQPASSGPVPASGINVAKAAVNAPPVQLHTGPASDRPADSGNLVLFILTENFFQSAVFVAESTDVTFTALLLVVISFFMHSVFQACNFMA